MKKCVSIISSRDLIKFEVIILKALTLHSLVILFISIIFWHFLAYYQGWDVLSFGWNPSKISLFAGITYFIFLVFSVLVHELGHLVMAIYRGDLSAEICILFDSFLPTFITIHDAKSERSKFGRGLPYLFGIFTQLLFASFLGIFYVLFHINVLVPSIVLIDVAALSSIVPFPGTDGYKFFLYIERMIKAKKEFLTQFEENSSVSYILRVNGIIGQFINHPRVFFSFGISLFFVYYIAVFILMIVSASQWLKGTTIKNGVEGYSTFYEILEFLIFFIPIIVYFLWASVRLPLTVGFIKKFSTMSRSRSKSQ